MNRNRRRVAVLASVSCAMGMAALLPPIATSANATATATRTVQSAPKGGYITTYTSANGDVTRIYDLSGPATITQSNDTIPATVGRPEQHGVGGEITTADTAAADKITSVPDVSEADMLTALGADSSTLAKFAQNDKAPTATPTAHTTSARTTAASSEYPRLRRSVCVGANLDGNSGNYYGCFRQWVATENSYGWALVDKFYMTGSMHDTSNFNPDELTGVAQGVGYPGGNEMVNWEPRRDYEGGSCKQRTGTISAFGQTYAETSTKCPERYGLQYISHWTFHTKWDGDGDGPSYGSRDTAGLDRVHKAVGASPTAKLYWYVWFE